MNKGKFRDKMSEVRITERLAKVAELSAQSWSQHQIAKAVGVSQVQVGRDQTELVKQWREQYLQDVDNLKAREINRLEFLIAKLWEEFELSKYRVIPPKIDSKTGKPVKGPEGKERKARVVANMEIVDRIQTCVNSIWKIYGIGQDTPGNTTNQTLNVFSVDRLNETLKAVAVEQETSRLAEVERMRQEQARLEAMTPTEDMSPLEKLQALRNRDRYEAARNGNGQHEEDAAPQEESE